MAQEQMRIGKKKDIATPERIDPRFVTQETRQIGVRKEIKTFGETSIAYLVETYERWTRRDVVEAQKTQAHEQSRSLDDAMVILNREQQEGPEEE